MLLRSAVIAALAVVSMSANATLTTYVPWENEATAPGANAPGVLFNVQTSNYGTLALGAHPYKNGVTMPNDGVSTFYAPGGLYNPTRANWSFDFGWAVNPTCDLCKVFLTINNNAYSIDLTNYGTNPSDTDHVNPESWNLEFDFLEAAIGYDPFSASSTVFELQIRARNGIVLARDEITVNVPEPATLALLGVGLAGLGFSRRRKS